jgi:hypothetical protein
MKFPGILKDTPLMSGVLMAKEWLEWVQSLGNESPAALFSGYAQRGDYSAANYPLGSRLVINDWGVTYESRLVGGQPNWVYAFGTYRSTLANKPAGLGTNGAGFLFHATDYLRTWRWTGTAWTYADGEKLAKEIIWYPGSAPSGYALCDGSSVTVTLADATTTSFTTPDLTGQYLKGGTYTGSVVAAVAPGITGSIDSAGAHTHSVSVSGTTGSSSVNATVDLGAATDAALDSHTHSVTATGSTDSQGSHTHTHTLAVDATGQPPHVLLTPCVKL